MMNWKKQRRNINRKFFLKLRTFGIMKINQYLDATYLKTLFQAGISEEENLFNPETLLSGIPANEIEKGFLTP